jgi:hypothetical protein
MRPGDYDRIYRTLNEAGVRYLVVGGVAAILHGVNRFTVDIDIIIDMSKENIGLFWRAMARLGYQPALPISLEQLSDPETIRLWREEKNLKAIKFWDPVENMALPLDLVVDHPLDFAAAHQRRATMAYHGFDLPVIGKDDLILVKNAAGRVKDRDDAEVLRDA